MGDGVFGGISGDIYDWVIGLINHGLGVSQHYLTNGNGTDTQLLSNVNRIVPAITVVNNGSNTIAIGYRTTGVNGANGFTIPAGASYTLRWKNPVGSKLVFNDLSHAATIDVMS